jgi:hypothetical protein
MSLARRNWIVGFYWIGVAMTVACFAFVLAGNTELLARFEHKSFPLSWVFGAAAVLAFLAAEFCHSIPSLPREDEDRESPLSAELETVES